MGKPLSHSKFGGLKSLLDTRFFSKLQKYLEVMSVLESVEWRCS
jgi:hypothetical protein